MSRRPLPPKASPAAEKMLEQLLAELDRDADTGGDGAPPVTKRQALIRSMVDEAIKGDVRMFSHVLKFLEKTDVTPPERPPEEEARTAAQDWESLFAFYGKYKPLIEQEIERRRQQNPAYWSFDYYHPTRESAPWYPDLYPENSPSPRPHPPKAV